MGIHIMSLSDEEEEALGELMASGRFPDEAEALRAGLAAGLKVLTGDEVGWAAFVARINDACDRARAGERAPGTWEEVKERVLRRAGGE